ncbi:signal peptide containing protein [Theileria equi strain WA]|uniref:Signal peptide containing protein n=1 Tax=Theileria equi strain WA TaxID=1537102 RepID=L1LDS9_THEEQ|nr:signal peptide containing protein [Theileria equi strain WA]EKX73602.1 signal peptide containing protein [Theileria equi strain WA]|eukprot:XP_004833054.1 signal peptide containing protein [Theileria equi strain WA]
MEYQRVPLMLVIGLLVLTHAVDAESSARDELIKIKEKLEKNSEHLSTVINGRDILSKRVKDVTNLVKGILSRSEAENPWEIREIERVENDIYLWLRQTYLRVASTSREVKAMLTDIENALSGNAGDIIMTITNRAKQFLDRNNTILERIEKDKYILNYKFRLLRWLETLTKSNAVKRVWYPHKPVYSESKELTINDISEILFDMEISISQKQLEKVPGTLKTALEDDLKEMNFTREKFENAMDRAKRIEAESLDIVNNAPSTALERIHRQIAGQYHELRLRYRDNMARVIPATIDLEGHLKMIRQCIPEEESGKKLNKQCIRICRRAALSLHNSTTFPTAHYVKEVEDAIGEMKELIERVRKESAVAQNGPDDKAISRHHASELPTGPLQDEPDKVGNDEETDNDGIQYENGIYTRGVYLVTFIILLITYHGE